MFKGECSFRGGVMKVSYTPRKFNGFRPALLGNRYRGLMIITAAGLWVWDYILFAGLVLALTLAWSLFASARGQWRRQLSKQRLLQMAARGAAPEEGTDDPIIIWQYVGAALSGEYWLSAISWLERLPDSEERDYWLAVAWMGKGDYQAVLQMCPARPDIRWLALKVQALYRLEAGKKLLLALRSARQLRVDKRTSDEWIYLRGAGYYFMKDFKPARNLLAGIVKKHGADYGRATEMLAEIEGWVK
ncbi:MAG: hypothetical protein FH749_08840 [Firmicutes bacterium]|nr:hypothetical protein [Bacillota bacterium]